MTDWTTVTDSVLQTEYLAINAEMGRRRTLEAAPAAQDALNEATLAAEGVTQGEPWRQPTGGHDAYPLDWVVTHEGKSWTSLTTANVWEPGVSGWREAGTEWPQWVQPTGAHDAYDIGAKVTYTSKHYTSKIDDNVWAPDAYPQGWALQP